MTDIIDLHNRADVAMMTCSVIGYIEMDYWFSVVNPSCVKYMYKADLFLRLKTQSTEILGEGADEAWHGKGTV